MLTPYQIAAELERIAVESATVWEDYAIAKATFENLSEYKKVVLARAFRRSEATSDKRKEAEALTSEDYKEFYEGYEVANTEYLKNLAKVKHLEISLACMQSLNKLTAAELNNNIVI